MLLFAQDWEAQCIITIQDEEGLPLPGALVIPGERQGLEQSLLSDRKGQVSIPAEWIVGDSIDVKVIFLGMHEIKTRLHAKGSAILTMKLNPSQMKEIVVTGAYAISNPERAAHRIDVITAEDIEEASASDISDVLRHAGEIQIQQNGVIGSGINIQGLADRNVKITINEVPVVGRVDGKLDLDQLDVQNIERIEIVKGPMAVSYGSDAIAGVINIITKTPLKEQGSANVRAYYSSEGQYDLLARISQSHRDYRASLRMGRRYFDGWSPTDPVFTNPQPIADERRNSLWNPKEQILAGLAHGLEKKTWSIDHRLDLFAETLKDRGSPQVNRPAQTIQAFDDEYKSIRIDNSLRYKRKFEKGKHLSSLLAFNYFVRERSQYLTDLTDLQRVVSQRDTTEYLALTTRHTWSKTAQEILSYQIGLDASWEQSIAERIVGNPSLLQCGGFTSAEWRAAKGLLVRPGIRMGYHELFNMPLIPSLALRYRHGQHTWRASVGKGFRAPDFKELYLVFFDANHNVFGNPELQAENSLNTSISHVFSYFKEDHQLRTEVSLFYNEVDDLISLVQVQGLGQGGILPYSYLNIDEVRTQGARIEASWQGKHLKLSTGFGLIGREDIVDGSLFNPMRYFPQSNANLSYQASEGYSLSLLYSFQGEQNTVVISDTQTERFTQESYSMMDLVLSKRVFKKAVKIQVGVRNLLDVSTLNSSSSSTGAVHEAGLTRPIGTGRNYFISLDYTIDWNE